MKKISIMAMILMFIGFSCSDEELTKEKIPAKQQIQRFIESAQKKNISAAELNQSLYAFIEELGGKPVTEFEMPRQEKVATNAGCKIGETTNFWLNEDEIVGVLNFTSCPELCPGTGNGYQVIVWTWKDNKWHKEVSYHCAQGNGSYD